MNLSNGNGQLIPFLLVHQHEAWVRHVHAVGPEQVVLEWLANEWGDEWSLVKGKLVPEYRGSSADPFVVIRGNDQLFSEFPEGDDYTAAGIDSLLDTPVAKIYLRIDDLRQLNPDAWNSTT